MFNRFFVSEIEKRDILLPVTHYDRTKNKIVLWYTH